MSNIDNIDTVLGIETSCDETAVAIYNRVNGVLAHNIYSQIDLHNQYGGVVPELASRDHIRKLSILIEKTLADAKLDKKDLDGIAYTRGPGLIGALLVGSTFAHSFAYALNIPIIGVHHMEGHLLAALLEDEKPELPFVALLVSGGHSMLVKVEKIGSYEILGDTLDDAAGEAFDKTAKILGLPYPGGPQISKLAEQGDRARFDFPRPLVKNVARINCDFSFSGLKTAVLNTVNQYENLDQETKQDIAASFETAVSDTIVNKCERALNKTNINNLVIAGGVSANKFIRQNLQTLMKKRGGNLYLPRTEYCTDNGAMIAYAGFLRLANGEFETDPVKVLPRWELDSL